MRDLGSDLIIFVGAVVLLAYGSLVIATRTAISDDLNALLGMPQKVANQQKPTIVGDGPTGNAGSLGNDIQNYVTYSYNGAIASIVVGVLQMVALIVKHAVRPSFYSGGRR
jgi:hypothetical protein